MEDKKWYQNKKIIIIAVVALVAVVGLSAFIALGGSSEGAFATVTTFPENDTTFRFVSDGNVYADEGLTFPAETTTSVAERTTEDDYYGYDDYDDEYGYYDDYEDEYYEDYEEDTSEDSDADEYDEEDYAEDEYYDEQEDVYEE